MIKQHTAGFQYLFSLCLARVRTNFWIKNGFFNWPPTIMFSLQYLYSVSEVIIVQCVVQCSALSVDYWLLSVKCWVLSAECWVLIVEFRVLSVECWVISVHCTVISVQWDVSVCMGTWSISQFYLQPELWPVKGSKHGNDWSWSTDRRGLNECVISTNMKIPMYPLWRLGLLIMKGFTQGGEWLLQNVCCCCC